VALDRQVQAAGIAGGDPRQIPFGLLESGQSVARQHQQSVPGGGQSHGFGMAVEQGHAVVVLEQFDLMGERRRCQMELLGGPRQAAAIGHREQAAQVLAVDHHEYNFILRVLI